ncbi:MAG TPA: glycosyltransferase family 9 protein [Candidatus Kapabacteria bacterium]|nr:glycosyltransferase family 9 protein [Candidatus Kapabacteria bacterium]
MKNRKIINYQMNKILIIRLSSIGDIVLSTHLIRNLRNHFIESRIDYICFSEYEDLLKENKRLTNLYTISKQFLKFGTKQDIINHFIKNNINNYDIVIDLHKNKYSRKIRRTISKVSEQKPIIFKVNKLRLHKLSLVLFKKPLKKNFQIPNLYFDAIRKLKINDDGKGLEIWLPNENEYIIRTRKTNNNIILNIALSPGAAHFTKQYPKEKFFEVAKNLSELYQCNFIILGGKKDIEICNYLANSINRNVINYCGKTSLIQTAQILNDCDLLITNDTGIMHIASARQIPTTAIFGSSVKELGFTPFRSPHQIVEHKIWCRPCSHIGREHCPLGHFKCMNEIAPTDIIQSASIFLKDIYSKL